MPIVSSQYWNMVHGYTPEDVYSDGEGCQIMRTLGKTSSYKALNVFFMRCLCDYTYKELSKVIGNVTCPK